MGWVLDRVWVMWLVGVMGFGLGVMRLLVVVWCLSLVCRVLISSRVVKMRSMIGVSGVSRVEGWWYRVLMVLKWCVWVEFMIFVFCVVVS